ncbi:MAG: hypothetical protein HOY69_20640, partial [Streptomyces sp.]|nr:hypothetical protein [Streptomyces sp.]
MKAASTNPRRDQAPPDSSWVDEVLLAGAGAGVCLDFGAPVTRAELRRLVGERQV